MIDSGSMISSIAESFYKTLPNRSQLHSISDFQLEVKSANGSIIPYLGYIEATIESSSLSGDSIHTLLLVVPTTEYNSRIPVLIGTNIIREMKQHTNADDVPDVWKTAFMSVESVAVGTVTSTQPITLKPMETRTVSGFVRKVRNVDAAVTEPVEDSYSQKALVCPRLVELNDAGKTARIPVRICDISAKVRKIPAKSELSQLNEVKVVRNADIGKPISEDTHENILNSDDHSISPSKNNLPVENLPESPDGTPQQSPPYLPNSCKASHPLEPEIKDKHEDEKYNLKKKILVLT